jgi:hypothetical protein
VPSSVAVPPSLIIQENHSAPFPPVKDGVTAMKIETEPSVHFTPYDTVFDETNDSVSEIRYTPKISVEDKPPSSWGQEDDDDDDSQERIKLGTEETSVSMSDIVDLDAPAPAAAAAPSEDVEVPLSSLGEFEELS